MTTVAPLAAAAVLGYAALMGLARRRERGWPPWRAASTPTAWPAASRAAPTPFLCGCPRWAAGCVLFDRGALLESGGFDFWDAIPDAAHGEDVLVQLRVMARRGGAGILPSGAYHQQSRTTMPSRGPSAVDVLPL